MRIVELEVTIEGCLLVLGILIERLDGRNHRVAPATVLHALVVPGALQILVAIADGPTNFLG